ncbi:MAG: alpha/beta hydrolase [Myxococcaceae bacterium]
MTGKLEFIRDLASPPEGISRTVRVFTPGRYARDRKARFGVVYMQDGQNVFAHPESAVSPSWSANLALERLLKARRIGPWMIVAVDHTGVGRFESYSPWPERRAGVKGRGELYGRFVVEHLKPLIDQRYRTRSEAARTAVVGSSLGGLISLYLGWRYPETFGRIGGLSPSVMWCHDELARRWDKKSPQPPRVYLDAGAQEHLTLTGIEMSYAQSVAAFHRHLQSLGYGDDELRLVLEPGAPHHESAWERRLPAALEWLLR